MYAITGLDCLLPGASTVSDWLSMDTPQIRQVPAGRWPGAEGPSTDRGAFVDEPHPDGDGPDPLFGWVERVVRGALGDRPPARAGLVLASLGLPSSGLVRASARDTLGAALLGKVPWLSGGHPLDRAQLLAPALRAAERADLGGPVETLDAACASGLYAVRAAMDLLDRGEADCVIAAAVNRSDSCYLFHGFSALRALSPSGSSRPFDTRADGLVVGEGAAAVMIEPLARAQARGAVIHAIIRSVAVGSDGRKGNLLAPSREGQLRTLRRAWQDAGIDPASLGLVECHATGTRLGDGVEIEALRALLAHRSGPPAVLHASKALVGHTVTAAGLASLLRAIGAVRDGSLPAQASCESPREELTGGPVAILRERAAWDAPVRVAAVSAFGFGGTNAHLVLQSASEAAPSAPRRRPRQPRLAVVGLAAAIGASRGEDALRGHTVGGRWPEHIDTSRFRIPPADLEAALPAQRAALDLADDLMRAAGDRVARARTAAVVGIEVDPAIGQSVSRIALAAAGLRAEADAIAGPLTAARVQGCLPNFAANRISDHLDLQGPSFVTAGGVAAVRAAARLLDDPAIAAAIAGAVDGDGDGQGRAGDGGVMMLLMRPEDAAAAGLPALAEIEIGAPPSAKPAPPSGLGAADGLAALAAAIVGRERQTVGGITARPVTFSGPFCGERLPRPIPHAPGSPVEPEIAARAAVGPLRWSLAPRKAPAVASHPPSTSPPPEAPRALPEPPLSGPGLVPEALAAGPAIARSIAATIAAVSAAHDRYLQGEAQAMAAIAALGSDLQRIISGHSLDRIVTKPIVERAILPTPAPPAPQPPAPQPPPSDTPPRSLDREGLLAHAGPSPLSAVFGPRYRDLDAFEPRVRMPLPPLLLCDRVLLIEGERGVFGPSRMVTEYDVPPASAQGWTADGRPPAFVVVESGQADLLLVSYLGIDALCRGKRVYRLLDCDLTFAKDRPLPGRTLRHDIRIERFARHGDTTLFYFGYDCTDRDSGETVLSMRGGCAGFFTPEELAHPRGLKIEARPARAQPPVAPLLGPPPASLGDEAPEALARRQFSLALGPSFAPADGSALTLPPDPRWRLVHRVLKLSLSGGAHGLGEVLFEQDLADDDWFNPVHFFGDPCMPGTLMLEGCLQAVHTWLIAAGLPAIYPDGRFEVVNRAIRLRCRGQVAPGHRSLRYHAQIREADLEGPTPYAIADVILSVDGVPVVAAYEVGARVVGERRPKPSPRGPAPQQLPIDEAHILEYSVGSAVRAFGPDYARFDRQRPSEPLLRCARMPGPPLLQMSEVLAVQGPPGETAADRSVTIAYDVPEDAWFFRAGDGQQMPFVILLETALQPCGWLTAWQRQGLRGDDLYFRNLGGTGACFKPVGPKAGRLLTAARQTGVSVQGGMSIQRFSVEVTEEASGERVFRCETQFGYFTPEALSAQKGLPNTPPVPLPPADRDLAGHPALPRDDLRMIDRLTGEAPHGGAKGLGRYSAVKKIDPSDWYFTAHFWLDPVMPGSLGLEALLQLARVVFFERTGYRGPVEPLPLTTEVSWTYRGQVRTHNAEMRVEIEITALTDQELRADGVIRADDLPIYRFSSFGVRTLAQLPAPQPLPRRSPPPRRVSALIERFVSRPAPGGAEGAGEVSLDPAQHPWLHAHRPTLTFAAVPLAFLAEIAAEAALLLAEGSQVVALPRVQIDRWIEERDGTLQVIAVRQGSDVAVTFAVSGAARGSAIVTLGEAPLPAKPLLPDEALTPEPDLADSARFFSSGLTFHGPLLQAMTALTSLSHQGATARLQTRPDQDLTGTGLPPFALDPLLLDAATHPMLSGEPERWLPEIGPGLLAYPVRLEDLHIHGPRPEGPAEVRIRRIEGEPRQLAFDVQISSSTGLWCSYRWRERLVPGGPLLGAPKALRRRFLWDHTGDPRVQIGRLSEEGRYLVRAGDLTEPMPGTTAALYGVDSAIGVAIKEFTRAHLRTVGIEVHPKDLTILQIRPGQHVVTACATIPAHLYVAHLHPTRFVVDVVREGPVIELRRGQL